MIMEKCSERCNAADVKDGRRGLPWNIKCLLKVGKCKEMDSPLGSPERKMTLSVLEFSLL